MSDTISFEELKSHLTSILAGIEKERLLLLKKAKKRVLISVAIVLGFFIILSIIVGDEWLPCILLGLFISPIIGIGVLPNSKKLSVIYKEYVVSPFVDSLLENGKYVPNMGISRSIFTMSGLFKVPDRFRSEDLVYGKKGKTSLSFSEVYAEEKHEKKNEKGEIEVTWLPFFVGFIFVADFHKHFLTYTKVRRRGILQESKQMRVKLEDPDFEKRFNVYSPDQVEARYILSTSMMQRIIDLDKKFKKKKMQISFVSSLMIIAIEDWHDYFEFDMWKSLNSPDTLRKEYDIVTSFMDIVEDLNLNTRIWSKE